MSCENGPPHSLAPQPFVPFGEVPLLSLKGLVWFGRVRTLFGFFLRLQAQKLYGSLKPHKAVGGTVPNLCSQMLYP